MRLSLLRPTGAGFHDCLYNLPAREQLYNYNNAFLYMGENVYTYSHIQPELTAGKKTQWTILLIRWESTEAWERNQTLRPTAKKSIKNRFDNRYVKMHKSWLKQVLIQKQLLEMTWLSISIFWGSPLNYRIANKKPRNMNVVFFIYAKAFNCPQKNRQKNLQLI